MLTYKAELVGVRVLRTEESYTSKSSYRESEESEPPSYQVEYVGKRVKRGLFITATGRRINADVNASYNMIIKVVPNAFGNGRAGVVVHPVRLNLTNRRLAA
jgi:putative transposase